MRRDRARGGCRPGPRIAAADIDGYLTASDVDLVSRDFLLVPAESDANVVIHMLPEGQQAYPESRLQLAADLADQRGAREELRAAALLCEVAEERGVAGR